jgi:hypothetical protein
MQEKKVEGTGNRRERHRQDMNAIRRKSRIKVG